MFYFLFITALAFEKEKKANNVKMMIFECGIKNEDNDCGYDLMMMIFWTTIVMMKMMKVYILV